MPVAQRPAVILRVGDLHSPGAERRRHFHQGGDAADVGAMDHGIDGERQPKPDHGLCERKLARVRPAIAGDAVRAVRLDVLQRELDMIEPRLFQPGPAGQCLDRSPR